MELWAVPHEPGSAPIRRKIGELAGRGKLAIEGSHYLGGLIPDGATRNKIMVLLEAPSLFVGVDGARSPSLLYVGGQAIEPRARGLRRMFEAIAHEIENGVSRSHLFRIVNELLYLRSRYPDAVVYHEPTAWLRTVWYESDLLFQYILERSKFKLFGAFIYSDMDKEFAAFLKEHGNSLSAMTGDDCLLFAFDGDSDQHSHLHSGSQYAMYRAVLETPGRLRDAPTAADLDKMREDEARMLSNIEGVNRSLLFGTKLGIRIEETPCIVFWKSLQDKQVVTLSFSPFDKDASNLSRIFKQLADAVRRILIGSEKDLLTHLQREIGEMTTHRLARTSYSVGDRMRKFLLENTPPVRERLYVEDIDNFKDVREVTPAEVSRFLTTDGFLDLPEDEVQRAMEKILDVPFHKKDWGGESNDLYSANVQINGIRVPTAFMLKGNGLRRAEMRIADCGKNGDQLLRLFNSPAHLFTVQFVGNVSEAVIGDVQGKVVERRRSGNLGWYLIMDGQDTARVLYAYGELK